MLGTINAIQYTRKNIDLIIEAFGFDPATIKVGYVSNDLSIGGRPPIHEGQWFVKVKNHDTSDGFRYVIVDDDVAHKLYEAVAREYH